MLNLSELKDLKFGPESQPAKTNVHIHLPPNFSAFEDVEDALDQADSDGVRLLGASNYYDYRVYGGFVAGALQRGVYPLLGMEVMSWHDGLARDGIKANDPGNPGKFYVCGKGVVGVADPEPEARQTLARIREGDAKRSAEMAARIEDVLSRHGLPTGMDEPTAIKKVVARHGVEADWVVLQERHLAMAFQEALFEKYAPDERSAKLGNALGKPVVFADSPLELQAELRSCLMKAGKPCYVEEAFVGTDEALALIRGLGGVPCYPVLADGASPVCGFEETPEGLVDSLKRLGIRTAEFIPVRNDPEVLATYVVALRQSGIVVGAGTEHNTLDRILLEPKCRGGRPIPAVCQAIFWEAACVFAGHQHRVLNGQPGFEHFEPASEEAVRLFAGEGARLIGGLKAAGD